MVLIRSEAESICPLNENSSQDGTFDFSSLHISKSIYKVDICLGAIPLHIFQTTEKCLKDAVAVLICMVPLARSDMDDNYLLKSFYYGTLHLLFYCCKKYFSIQKYTGLFFLPKSSPWLSLLGHTAVV